MRYRICNFETGSVKVVAYISRKSNNSYVDQENADLAAEKTFVPRLRIDTDTGEILNGSDPQRAAARSKSLFMEYALNHRWDWFVTLTLDPKKHDRYKDHFGAVAQWLRHARQRRFPGLEYALVPELHADGAYHYHMLLSGVPASALVDTGRRAHGRPVYTWRAAEMAWGWTTCSPVDTSDAVVRYVSKYMSKAISATDGGLLPGSVRGAGRRRWSVSAGVQRVASVTVEDLGGDAPTENWYAVEVNGRAVAWVRWGVIGDDWITAVCAFPAPLEIVSLAVSELLE